MASRFLQAAARQLIPAVALVCTLAPAFAAAQTQSDFFNDEKLQEIRFVISSRDWRQLQERADENTYYLADLRWNGMTLRNLGIRSRGNGTRTGVKPGLRIDVNRYLGNQTFLGLRSFILDNAYTDPSSLRESLAMKLFARMGIPAPREAHARVYVNNEYVGLYVIVEAVDRAFIARAFGAEEAQVEKGGYLFEYKWILEYHFEFLDTQLERYAALFKPQTRDTDSMVALYKPIEEMVRAINEADDRDFESEVGKYLDLRLFMKQLAVEIFVADSDGFAGNWGTNNFYLYRFRDGLRSQIIPWDKDQAFQVADSDITLRLDQNVLTRRALAIPSLRAAYLDAIAQCVQIVEETAGDDDPRGWLEREVDRQFSQIETAVAEDARYPFSEEERAAELDNLRRFARNRPQFMQCQAGNMTDESVPPQPCSIPPVPPSISR